MTEPEPVRDCQCKNAFCTCIPCPKEMDGEDLLCSGCREFKIPGNAEDGTPSTISPHCHRTDGPHDLIRMLREGYGSDWYRKSGMHRYRRETYRMQPPDPYVPRPRPWPGHIRIELPGFEQEIGIQKPDDGVE